MRVRCLTLEHNTMFQGRTRARTARPGDERTNHEATNTAAKRMRMRQFRHFRFARVVRLLTFVVDINFVVRLRCLSLLL